MKNVEVEIYTDGACSNNPGVGGYGAILFYKDSNRQVHEKKLSKGFNMTTNNRMEILSVIEGLKALKQYDIPVEIYSDSQYVVNTVTLNWKKNANQDLWEQLHNYIGKVKDIKFIKVKGHSDNIYNNRADQLANEAMDALK